MDYICESIRSLAANFAEWGRDYLYNSRNSEFVHKTFASSEGELVKKWFHLKD